MSMQMGFDDLTMTIMEVIHNMWWSRVGEMQ